MASPTLSLSGYQCSARSLAAKSALPLATAAAALLAPSAHAQVVAYSFSTDNSVGYNPGDHYALAFNFFTGAQYIGLSAENHPTVILNLTPGILNGYAGQLATSIHLAGDVDGSILLTAEAFAGSFAPQLLTGGQPVNGALFSGGGDTSVGHDGYFRPPYYYAAAPLWANVSHGYIAFAIGNNGHTYYGWAALSTNGDGTRVTLEAFGLNHTPDTAIATGEGLTAVPEPAMSATLLALGAAGLAAYRRRKNLQRAS